MKAKDILRDLAEIAPLGVGCSLPRPGDMIERLSPEKREILKELTSDDIKDDRHPMEQYWYDLPEDYCTWTENSSLRYHRDRGLLDERWKEKKESD